MPEPKLLVFDLDGTLLDASHQVPETIRPLLFRLREEGIETTLATGRPFMAVRRFVLELDLRLPLILFNGAVLLAPDGEDLWSRRLPRHIAKGALGLLNDPEVANHLYLDPADAFFYTDQMSAAAKHVMEKDGMAGQFDGDLAGLLDRQGVDPIKVFSIGPRGRLEKVKERFEAAAPGHTCVFSEHDMLEFLGTGVTKGAALRILCERIAVPLDSVMAFGDNLNDLELVSEAGIGIAMASAPEDLRSAADHVIEDIGEFLLASFGSIREERKQHDATRV